MGQKYDISFFKVSALGYLRNLFPRTLEQWKVSYLAVRKIVMRSKPFLFEVVNMAYENHMPSILPAAFLSMYKICFLVRLQYSNMSCKLRLLSIGSGHTHIRIEIQIYK